MENISLAFESFATVASTLPVSSSSSASPASFLRVGTWKVLSEGGEKYLVASVQSNTSVHTPHDHSSSMSGINVYDLEEEDLQFEYLDTINADYDRQGKHSKRSSSNEFPDPHPESLLRGELHVVYHPMYQIPCLYLRIRDADNKIITAQDYSDMIGVVDPDFELFEEYHPILQTPYICPHICSVRDKLTVMMVNEPSESSDDYGGSSHLGGRSAIKVDGMFVARFLTIVGPMLGLTLNPADYVLLENGMSIFN